MNTEKHIRALRSELRESPSGTESERMAISLEIADCPEDLFQTCAERLADLEKRNKAMREVLQLIAESGGDTPSYDRPYSCNGSWCAEQARRALEIL